MLYSKHFFGAVSQKNGKKLSLLDFNMIYVYFELLMIRICNGFDCVTMELFPYIFFSYFRTSRPHS